MSAEKIMVVEDDLTLSAGLCFELDMNGYLTVAAYNIKKARQLAGEDTFDLVILDVNLPDGSGFDLCRELKERESGLPVIFLTANDLEEDVVAGFDLGADDYVTKPFSMKILLKRVAAALRHAGGRGPAPKDRWGGWLSVPGFCLSDSQEGRGADCHHPQRVQAAADADRERGKCAHQADSPGKAVGQ